MKRYTIEELEAMPADKVNALVHEAMGRCEHEFDRDDLVYRSNGNSGIMCGKCGRHESAEILRGTAYTPDYLHDKAAAWDVMIFVLGKGFVVWTSTKGRLYIAQKKTLKVAALSAEREHLKAICYAAIIAAGEKE